MISLYLNNVAARDRDRLSRIDHNKINKGAQHDYKFAVNMHA
jgi:hypothetical protein